MTCVAVRKTLHVVLPHQILPHGGAISGRQPIVQHGPGSFLGELAQLSDRPALVDATADGAVEAIVVPSRRLRDVLVQEAELGERIMRALILRRVGLLEAGQAGPIVIGVFGSADMLRLENFLRRSGHVIGTARSHVPRLACRAVPRLVKNYPFRGHDGRPCPTM
jgi:thioredoxin reductase (NADPH)